MHLPFCVNKGEDIAFMCLGQSISDWLELTGGVSGNICKDITRRPGRQRKRLETAFLKPVSWKVFRLETLMRIWAATLSTNSRKLSSAVDLVPHTWKWKSGGLYLNTTPCGSRMASVLFRWPVSWRSEGFANLSPRVWHTGSFLLRKSYWTVMVKMSLSRALKPSPVKSAAI